MYKELHCFSMDGGEKHEDLGNSNSFQLNCPLIAAACAVSWYSNFSFTKTLLQSLAMHVVHWEVSASPNP